MLMRFVINILLMIVYRLSNADEVPKVSIKYLKPDKGTEGYDLFFYDGQSLRDEKWRFDRNTGSTIFSRRNGFRDLGNFHLVDATIDALGSFTKSYNSQNEKELIENRVKEPQTQKDVENIKQKAMSGGFTGVSFNTQYSSQYGYPHLSNIVGIQNQHNVPNPSNGLNFHQTFTTPQFGFQQQGSLFNQQGPFPTSAQPNFSQNPNFQFASLFMPFFNHNNNNNKPNQQYTFGSFGSFPSFGTPGIEQGNSPSIDPQIVGTQTTPANNSPNVPYVISVHSSSTSEASVDTSTTIDPTLNFDIRSDEEKDESNNNTTSKFQTTTRRVIEGLPTSDEESTEEGILDKKISSQVLKTLVG